MVIYWAGWNIISNLTVTHQSLAVFYLDVKIVTFIGFTSNIPQQAGRSLTHDRAESHGDGVIVEVLINMACLIYR